MLDAKLIRTKPHVVEAALQKRNISGALDRFIALDEERRAILGKVEELKGFRNSASMEVGRMKKSLDPSALMEKVRQVGIEIKAWMNSLKSSKEIWTIFCSIYPICRMSRCRWDWTRMTM